VNHNDIIIKTILAFKKHPKAYLRGELSYYAVEAFLNGYLIALEQSHSIELGKMMRIWFQKKINEKSSCSFTAHIDHYYESRIEEDRINILIDLVGEFFTENPEWYL